MIIKDTTKGLTKKGKTKPRIPNDENITKMLEAVMTLPGKEPEVSMRIALVHFLAATGARNEEAVNLNCQHFDFLDLRVRIRGKGDKDRDVPFKKEVGELLKKYWALRGWRSANDPAFALHTNRVKEGEHKRITTNRVRLIVDMTQKAAGVDGEFSPHYFRHYVASRLLAESGNVKLVKEMLGHADIGTTDIYLHVNIAELDDAYRKAFEED